MGGVSAVGVAYKILETAKFLFPFSIGLETCDLDSGLSTRGGILTLVTMMEFGFRLHMSLLDLI